MEFFSPGDSRYDLVRKLLINAGGMPEKGDNIHALLKKYLTAIGGTPIHGDHWILTLSKIVTIKGGNPAPGDHEWDLLVKWLQAIGICRACGDSKYDLWKQLLQAEAYVIPTNVVTIKASALVIDVTWDAVRDPSVEWKLQIVSCLDESILWDLTRLPEDRATFVANFPNYPAGQWRARLRDADAPEDAWVDGNCVTYP